jgi:hypothetical protein
MQRKVAVHTLATQGFLQLTSRLASWQLMATVQEYLDAYDEQLRTDAETPGAVAVTRLGPLRLVTFAGGRGFVPYRDLDSGGSAAIARWVEGALAHSREDPGITRVEWKTRSHDRAPGLHKALVRTRFVSGEPESIMIGEVKVSTTTPYLWRTGG